MRVRTLTTRAVALLSALSLATGIMIGVAPPASADITQSNVTTTTASISFSDHLNAPVVGPTFTYTLIAASTGLTVSLGGAIGTTGTLPAAGYSANGTYNDGVGDTGNWSYTLTVSGVNIGQGSPSAGSTTPGASNGFGDALRPTTFNGASVTYTQSASGSLCLNVGTTGAVSVNCSLAAGPYNVSGTDANGIGDTGGWSYTLTVGAATITQTSPTANFVTVAGSNTFTDQLNVSGNSGTVTFVEQSSTSPNLAVSTSGLVSVTGSLAANTYTVSGSLSDTSGGNGVFTYTLNVLSQPPTGGGTITQTSTTSGSTTAAASASYVIGPIVVANALGTVTFVTTTSSPGLSVSQSGNITTTGTLAAGAYTVSGTDSDPIGDAGTWEYSLTVIPATYAVTFDANGGTGTMAAESASSPTALTLASLTRAGYEFTSWNTAPGGSGTTFADGSTYPFTSATTLYAQWRVVTVVKKPTAHAVRFVAHGGTGTMKTEKSKSPAGLTPNRFKRKGFSFVQWNTAANGSGSNFANRAQYPFSSSVTLYAQWRAKKAVVLFAVTFNADGGSGTMATQRGRVPTALSHNLFSRKGFDFNGWSTAANGSGTPYADGGVFPFASSTVLYAQWKAKKVVVLPPINAVVTLGLFTTKSSTLSAGLQAQVKSLAREVKANRDTRIKLVGFGDALSAAAQANETKWVANFALSKRRATAVETFLAQQLTALGVAGFTISAAGGATAGPGTSGPSAATKAKDGEVIATLT
jgi:outer membrane protein OmpA-like peptidoglycan-associated protein